MSKTEDDEEISTRNIKRPKTLATFKNRKTLKKKIKREIMTLKRNKIRNKVKPNDPKSLWQAVNLSMNNINSTIPGTVNWNGNEAKTDEEKAFVFCNFFNSKINNIINANSPDPTVYNGKKKIFNDFLEPFTINEVIKILNNLPNKNCSGYDRIPLIFFKDAQLILAPTIHSLIIKIWNSNVIPETWKITKTLPLHKKGDKKDVENYRPISNLCSLAKIFEKLLQLKLEKLADNNNIDLTGTLQHGFKKNHSTITAMLSIQNKISNALDKNKYAAMTSLDLSAAFDIVDHNLLLKRLQIMGLPKKIVTLIRSWLFERKMYVDVNNMCSILTDILAGTLQGSCLGPILFALFISPVYDLVDCFTYADDNYTIETGKNFDETIGKVKMKSEILITWLKKSGMKVNTGKTEFCIFHKNDVPTKTIVLDNAQVQSKPYIKVLGTTFDSKLNWFTHVNQTLQKCRKTLQAVKLISKFFTVDERLNIITSLFYSQLYYASEVWLLPSLSFTLKNKLLSISTTALRIVANDQCRVFNSNDLHIMFKRFTPTQWRVYCNLLCLYRIINFSIPEQIWIELQINALPLSRANKILFPPKNKIKVGLNSFTNRISYCSTLITNDNLNLSYNSFKILAKQIATIQA